MFTITATARHVAWVIDECLRTGVTEVEPTTDAQDAWWNTILAGIEQTWRYQLKCTPGYLNNEGGGDMRSARSAAYMGSALAYADELTSWRETGDLAGLEMQRAE